MVELLYMPEFSAWFDGLTEQEQATVQVSLRRLQQEGLSLGWPHSSSIKGSRHALRELRPKQGRSPLRPFYVFDPRRNAVLLTGGDKAGDNRFYDRIVPIADAIIDRHLADLKRRPKGG